MGSSAHLGDRGHFHINIAGRDEPVAVASRNMERASKRITGGSERKVWLTWSEDSVVLPPPE